jgi:ribosomal protein S18 acetylase RimI-like enzyme
VREAAFKVRPAQPADIPDLMVMKRELAAADNALAVVRATPDDWHRDFFGPQPRFLAVVATKNGLNIGMATFNERHVTGWPGVTIYLQDLFVDRAYRRQGVGRTLITCVAAYARERGSPIIELNMHTANPAGDFYRRQGFQLVSHCAVYVAGLPALAQPASTAADENAKADSGQFNPLSSHARA